MTQQSRTIIMAFTFSVALTFVGGVQSQVLAEDMPKSSPEMQAEGTATDAGDIQERAVPRMRRPGMTAPKTVVPSKSQGLAVQGNRLQAMPGYVLKTGPKNQVSAMRPTGGFGLTATCKCMDGSGDCMISTQDDVAICSKSPNKVCQGSCAWDLGLAPSGGGLMR